MFKLEEFMKIGILTFYKVANFGANLQAISTYCYLRNHGHEPIFINYMSSKSYKNYVVNKDSIKWKAHMDTIDEIIQEQTKVCFNTDDIMDVIKEKSIESLIIGSDAVLQHHPLLARICRGKRKPIRINPIDPERIFPNPFWGCGIADKLPTVLMSVSSQNSAYNIFSKKTVLAMRAALQNMRYISVRDNWTQQMVNYIVPDFQTKITPDPVFAFNFNAKTYIPSKQHIIKKFHLVPDYVLFSIHNQCVDYNVMKDIKQHFGQKGISVIFLPIPTGGGVVNHPFDYEIKFPLCPFDWYALIKYSCAYIGSNMHPIVVSLHNGVPCYSIDNWGRTNFWGHKIDDGSSKVLDILRRFNVENCHKFIENSHCDVTSNEIFDALQNFPVDYVNEKAKALLGEYKQMMTNIITAINDAKE